MKKDKREISAFYSAAMEYLTFVASTGDDKESIEMRYEDKTMQCAFEFGQIKLLRSES